MASTNPVVVTAGEPCWPDILGSRLLDEIRRGAAAAAATAADRHQYLPSGVSALEAEAISLRENAQNGATQVSGVWRYPEATIAAIHNSSGFGMIVLPSLATNISTATMTRANDPKSATGGLTEAELANVMTALSINGTTVVDPQLPVLLIHQHHSNISHAQALTLPVIKSGMTQAGTMSDIEVGALQLILAVHENGDAFVWCKQKELLSITHPSTGTKRKKTSASKSAVAVTANIDAFVAPKDGSQAPHEPLGGYSLLASFPITDCQPGSELVVVEAHYDLVCKAVVLATRTSAAATDVTVQMVPLSLRLVPGQAQTAPVPAGRGGAAAAAAAKPPPVVEIELGDATVLHSMTIPAARVDQRQPIMLPAPGGAGVYFVCKQSLSLWRHPAHMAHLHASRKQQQPTVAAAVITTKASKVQAQQQQQQVSVLNGHMAMASASWPALVAAANTASNIGTESIVTTAGPVQASSSASSTVVCWCVHPTTGDALALTSSGGLYAVSLTSDTADGATTDNGTGVLAGCGLGSRLVSHVQHFETLVAGLMSKQPSPDGGVVTVTIRASGPSLFLLATAASTLVSTVHDIATGLVLQAVDLSRPSNALLPAIFPETARFWCAADGSSLGLIAHGLPQVYTRLGDHEYADRLVALLEALPIDADAIAAGTGAQVVALRRMVGRAVCAKLKLLGAGAATTSTPAALATGPASANDRGALIKPMDSKSKSSAAADAEKARAFELSETTLSSLLGLPAPDQSAKAAAAGLDYAAVTSTLAWAVDAVACGMRDSLPLLVFASQDASAGNDDDLTRLSLSGCIRSMRMAWASIASSVPGLPSALPLDEPVASPVTIARLVLLLRVLGMSKKDIEDAIGRQLLGDGSVAPQQDREALLRRARRAAARRNNKIGGSTGTTAAGSIIVRDDSLQFAHVCKHPETKPSSTNDDHRRVDESSRHRSASNAVSLPGAVQSGDNLPVARTYYKRRVGGTDQNPSGSRHRADSVQRRKDSTRSKEDQHADGHDDAAAADRDDMDLVPGGVGGDHDDADDIYGDEAEYDGGDDVDDEWDSPLPQESSTWLTPAHKTLAPHLLHYLRLHMHLRGLLGLHVVEEAAGRVDGKTTSAIGVLAASAASPGSTSIHNGMPDGNGIDSGLSEAGLLVRSGRQVLSRSGGLYHRMRVEEAAECLAAFKRALTVQADAMDRQRNSSDALAYDAVVDGADTQAQPQLKNASRGHDRIAPALVHQERSIGRVPPSYYAGDDSINGISGDASSSSLTGEDPLSFETALRLTYASKPGDIPGLVAAVDAAYPPAWKGHTPESLLSVLRLERMDMSEVSASSMSSSSSDASSKGPGQQRNLLLRALLALPPAFPTLEGSDRGRSRRVALHKGSVGKDLQTYAAAFRSKSAALLHSRHRRGSITGDSSGRNRSRSLLATGGDGGSIGGRSTGVTAAAAAGRTDRVASRVAADASLLQQVDAAVASTSPGSPVPPHIASQVHLYTRMGRNVDAVRLLLLQGCWPAAVDILTAAEEADGFAFDAAGDDMQAVASAAAASSSTSSGSSGAHHPSLHSRGHHGSNNNSARQQFDTHVLDGIIGHVIASEVCQQRLAGQHQQNGASGASPTLTTLARRGLLSWPALLRLQQQADRWHQVAVMCGLEGSTQPSSTTAIAAASITSTGSASSLVGDDAHASLKSSGSAGTAAAFATAASAHKGSFGSGGPLTASAGAAAVPTTSGVLRWKTTSTERCSLWQALFRHAVITSHVEAVLMLWRRLPPGLSLPAVLAVITSALKDEAPTGVTSTAASLPAWAILPPLAVMAGLHVQEVEEVNKQMRRSATAKVSDGNVLRGWGVSRGT